MADRIIYAKQPSGAIVGVWESDLPKFNPPLERVEPIRIEIFDVVYEFAPGTRYQSAGRHGGVDVEALITAAHSHAYGGKIVMR